MLVKVAIIDDDSVYRFVTAALLGKTGMNLTVFSYENAETAIEAWEKQPADFPDLIFLDINMHALYGWDLLDYLVRNNYPKARVFMVSSSMLQGDVEKSKVHPYGVNGYVLKPLRLDKIREIFAFPVNEFLILDRV